MTTLMQICLLNFLTFLVLYYKCAMQCKINSKQVLIFSILHVKIGNFLLKNGVLYNETVTQLLFYTDLACQTSIALLYLLQTCIAHPKHLCILFNLSQWRQSVTSLSLSSSHQHSGFETTTSLDKPSIDFQCGFQIPTTHYTHRACRSSTSRAEPS